MSRPLGAKVHYNHMMISRGAQCDTTTTATTRSSWYNDEDDDSDKNDDLSSSSYSISKENLTVPCWGEWLLKLTTYRQTKQQQQPQQQHRLQLHAVLRKPSTKVLATSSSTTSLDSDIGHDDDDYDHESSCCSRCMTPPCPPMVSFPKSRANNREEDSEEEQEEEHLSDDMQLIRSLEVEGDRFENDGLLVEALSVYQRLLELHRATGQSADRIGNVHYRTGMIQYKRNYYNEALCHFDQALFIYQLNYNPDEDYPEIDEDDDDDNYSGNNDIALDFYRAYVATGHVHLSNHNPFRAIDYFHRALQFVKPETTSTLSTLIHKNHTTASKRRDAYDTYYAQVLHALATAYVSIGDDTEARLHYQKAAAVLSTKN